MFPKIVAGTDLAFCKFMNQALGTAQRLNESASRVHLKRDVSRRLALCGIFPRESFKLVAQVSKLNSNEQALICKLCLQAAGNIGGLEQDQ